MRVSFSLHPHQHLLLFVFLMIAILTGVRWKLNVDLICISFMARDGEHFFMCFLARQKYFELFSASCLTASVAAVHMTDLHGGKPGSSGC
jgi:hypothetical protein